MNYDYSPEDLISRLPLFFCEQKQANVSAINTALNYSLSADGGKTYESHIAGLTHSKNCSCHNRPTEKQSKITKTSKSSNE